MSLWRGIVVKSWKWCWLIALKIKLKKKKNMSVITFVCFCLLHNPKDWHVIKMGGNYRNCHMRFIFGLVPWCHGWWAAEVGILFLCSRLTLIWKSQTTNQPKPPKTPKNKPQQKKPKPNQTQNKTKKPATNPNPKTKTNPNSHNKIPTNPLNKPKSKQPPSQNTKCCWNEFVILLVFSRNQAFLYKCESVVDFCS